MKLHEYLTPEAVTDAYKKTGWLPIREEWQNPYSCCACAIGVLAQLHDVEISSAADAYKFLTNQGVECSPGDVRDFVFGFDGECLPKKSDTFKLGRYIASALQIEEEDE
jgi:hypothetical protein